MARKTAVSLLIDLEEFVNADGKLSLETTIDELFTVLNDKVVEEEREKRLKARSRQAESRKQTSERKFVAPPSDE